MTRIGADGKDDPFKSDAACVQAAFGAVHSYWARKGFIMIRGLDQAF